VGGGEAREDGETESRKTNPSKTLLDCDSSKKKRLLIEPPHETARWGNGLVGEQYFLIQQKYNSVKA